MSTQKINEAIDRLRARFDEDADSGCCWCGEEESPEDSIFYDLPVCQKCCEDEEEISSEVGSVIIDRLRDAITSAVSQILVDLERDTFGSLDLIDIGCRVSGTISRRLIAGRHMATADAKPDRYGR